MTSYSVGNWLFLLGSIVFTGDAIGEVFVDFSLRPIEHLVTSLLFTAGCILFLHQPPQQEDSKLL